MAKLTLLKMKATDVGLKLKLFQMNSKEYDGQSSRYLRWNHGGWLKAQVISDEI